MTHHNNIIISFPISSALIKGLERTETEKFFGWFSICAFINCFLELKDSVLKNIDKHVQKVVLSYESRTIFTLSISIYKPLIL